MGLGTFLSDWYGINGSIGLGVLEGHLRMNPSQFCRSSLYVFFCLDEQGLGDFLLEATELLGLGQTGFFLQTFP